MSAIWGTLSFNHNISSSSIDETMRIHYTAKCKLDRIETASTENCYYACGIQHLTDEAKHEILPIYDRDNGFIITADCILDNRTELLDNLNISDNNIPDGTIIYHAYLKWRNDAFSKLKGLFSIAVYDKKSNQLILASDHMASRCLYYYRHANGITFSTLLAPILKLHPDIQPNELYYMDYLKAPGLIPKVIGTETPYTDVFAMPPASYAVFSANSSDFKQYWHPSMEQDKFKCKTPAEYLDTFKEVMHDAVYVSLRSCGGTGILLSSGMDSLTVGTLAATELAKGNKPLNTYTYVPVTNDTYQNESYYVLNEQPAVLEVSKMYPNMCCKFLNNGGKDCVSEIPKILDVLEIPFKSIGNSPNLYEIYETAAADGCKVVLSGQYGNSTISHGYINDVLYDLYERKSFAKFLFYINNYCKYMKQSRKAGLKNCLSYFKRVKQLYKSGKSYATSDNPFLNEEYFRSYPVKERFDKGGISSLIDAPAPGEHYKKLLCLNNELIFLGEIETKMGLKHGIILRDPTRDKNVFTFCYNLPYELFAYKGTPRWLVREGMKEYFPSSILNDWMRYGLQNCDWIQRIKNNWATLYPIIVKTLNNCILNNMSDNDTLYSYLKTQETAFNEDDNNHLYLLFLHVLGCYIK